MKKLNELCTMKIPNFTEFIYQIDKCGQALDKITFDYMDWESSEEKLPKPSSSYAKNLQSTLNDQLNNTFDDTLTKLNGKEKDRFRELVYNFFYNLEFYFLSIQYLARWNYLLVLEHQYKSKEKIFKHKIDAIGFSSLLDDYLEKDIIIPLNPFTTLNNLIIEKFETLAKNLKNETLNYNFYISLLKKNQDTLAITNATWLGNMLIFPD